MNLEEMKESMEALAREKGIELRKLAEAFVLALESAYKSLPGAFEQSRAELDLHTWRFAIYVQETDEDGNPVGAEFEDTPDDEEFGRIAAKTFRDVLGTQVRQAENEQKFIEYSGREGDIVTGIVQQSDARFTMLNLGGAEALLPRVEQVQFERLETNTRVKAYLVEVRRSDRGPQIVVSRTHPGLIRRLFELEVPEVVEGTVEIMACAREPGYRTKIAVHSGNENVDPVGACVGARGSRVRGIVNELRGEKIDIVLFSEDPAEYVMRALFPAEVKHVEIFDETNTAEVVVNDFQLSLAIGKEGQNARLAARLTGYRIEIKSETQAAEEKGIDLDSVEDAQWSDFTGAGADAEPSAAWSADEAGAGEGGGKGKGGAKAGAKAKAGKSEADGEAKGEAEAAAETADSDAAAETADSDAAAEADTEAVAAADAAAADVAAADAADSDVAAADAADSDAADSDAADSDAAAETDADTDTAAAATATNPDTANPDTANPEVSESEDATSDPATLEA